LIAVGQDSFWQWLESLESLRNVPSLAIVNRYGLFAVMTTSRSEIVIEGSDDGIDWKTYEFNFKAGDVSKPPRLGRALSAAPGLCRCGLQRSRDMRMCRGFRGSWSGF